MDAGAALAALAALEIPCALRLNGKRSLLPLWASGSIAVDVKNKIVRRDAIQVAINEYLVSHGMLLTKDKGVQEAFIRNFDHLADI